MENSIMEFFLSFSFSKTQQLSAVEDGSVVPAAVPYNYVTSYTAAPM